MKQKNIVVLGSTGSIGESAFRILSHFPDRFHVVGLAARSRTERLAQQAAELHADFALTTDPARGEDLARHLPASCRALTGEEAMVDLVTRPEVDVVLCAIVGTGGFAPVAAAIRAGKTIALASKEVMVMAGEWINRELDRNPAASLIPVDSEHSAIFQCLTGRRADEVASLVLTASGGTFRDASAEEIANATWERALQHPTWNMGPKITVDSASLMNKALEMVEARYLFRVAPEKIEVLLHPQSLIHSMIRMTDGAFMAQMSVPDMRFAIQYAFTYPERIGGDLPQMAFDPAVQLTFALPDRKKFPSLDFAEEAMRCGGTMPAVMNAANEIAVEKFFRGEIAFPQIWSIIEQTMSAHRAAGQDILEEILEADRWARDYAAHSCQ